MLRRCCGVLLCFVLLAGHLPGVACAKPPALSAKSAVVMVAQTGEVVYAYNAHEKRAMASTTKLMTALLALEEATPTQMVTVTEKMVPVEGSALGLKAGYKITLVDLVAGMLLLSGNDAANVVAHTLAGSTQAFAQRMNTRAKELGMHNSNFVTPSGLDDKNHYSTAYDMALLGCAAIQNVQLAQIAAQKTCTIAFGDPPVQRTIRNSNRLLREYTGCVGLKTGFTKKSGRCLVSAATRDGVTLVAVTLSAPNDWSDHKALLDYSFAQVKATELDLDASSLFVPVVGGVKNRVAVRCAQSAIAVCAQSEKTITRVVLLRPFEYAPIVQGKIIGEVQFYQGDNLLACTALVTAESIEQQTPTKIKRNRIANLLESL